MSGALLRSGSTQGFQALGSDGQPVYSAALPLREAVRLKLGEDAAACFALVQPSENGEHFDWYAPFEGEVVPWSSASEAERSHALAQLAVLNGQLSDTAAHMAADTGNREKQLFARLLRQAMHFPGSDYVYLVNGKPVITFWGFAVSGSDNLDPLRHLRLPAAIAPTPAAPTVAPVVLARSRWRWLWWLLLLLLLLLLILFLLRACAPQVKLPLGLNDMHLPGLADLGRTPDSVRPDSVVGESTARTGSRDVVGANRVGGVAADTDVAVGANVPPGQDIPLMGDLAPDGQGLTPDTPASPDASIQPPAFVEPDPAAVPGPELHIPPEAIQEGSTDFLNGRWQADAGVMDARTNQPLKLEYVFKNGQGTARIERDDGVTCRGAVTASITQGERMLDISKGIAKCSNGREIYDLPTIRCNPDEQGAAQCRGLYEESNTVLNMGMRRYGN